MADWNFMVGNSVVNRYVRSLYDVSAADGLERDVAYQLNYIKECILHLGNTKKFLKRMSLLPEEGRKFIEFLKMNLELSVHVGNFLDLLLHNCRFDMIIDICNAYSSLLDKIDGKEIFYITFAKEISTSIVYDFIRNITDILGGTVECITKKDPSLIDGVRIQYRSKVLDYSAKSRLRRLHGAIRRENYEN